MIIFYCNCKDTLKKQITKVKKSLSPILEILEIFKQFYHIHIIVQRERKYK